MATPSAREPASATFRVRWRAFLLYAGWTSRRVSWPSSELLAARRPAPGTTNLAVLDADGNACVLTTSLGLGSGDFLPGFDLHLNSMLGEADLVQEPLEPGLRMASMMSPAVALGNGSVQLAAGAAGGTRLRSALLQVVAGVLDEGLEPQAAVDRPASTRSARRSARTRLRVGHVRSTRGRRIRGARLAGATPLLRRCERGHADRRRGGSEEKRRCASPP